MSAYTRGQQFASTRVKQFHSLEAIWNAAIDTNPYKTVAAQKNFVKSVQEVLQQIYTDNTKVRGI